MKKILKRAVIPVFLSVLCGFLCSHIIYKIYLKDDGLSINNNLVYLIQSGAYSSYDNMRANATNYDYIYYEEDELFKTVIGVTKSKQNIEKIKKVYNGDVIVHEYYSEDLILNNKLSEYDNILFNVDDDVKIKEIVIKMLNLYKDVDDIKLIKVS